MKTISQCSSSVSSAWHSLTPEQEDLLYGASHKANAQPYHAPACNHALHAYNARFEDNLTQDLIFEELLPLLERPRAKRTAEAPADERQPQRRAIMHSLNAAAAGEVVMEDGSDGMPDGVQGGGAAEDDDAAADEDGPDDAAVDAMTAKV